MSEFTLNDFRGPRKYRIELHPGTDAWMSGDQFGSVVRVGIKWLYVKMERSGRTRKVHPSNVGRIM